VQLLQQQDSQRTGSISLSRLIQTLQTLSQDCLGLTNICLACIIGCTASDATDSVLYKQWAGPAAAMMYSILDPRIASTRHAALTEFRGRDESDRNRSVNVQSIKVCLQRPFAFKCHTNLAYLLASAKPLMLVDSVFQCSKATVSKLGDRRPFAHPCCPASNPTRSSAAMAAAACSAGSCTVDAGLPAASFPRVRSDW